MKIALIHDYLREYGGAERVMEALHELYPDAPVYVAFLDWQALGSQAARFKSWDIRTTWMSKIPFITWLYSPLRIIADRAFASLDLSSYDVVISSSNAYFAKAVRVPNGVHICYCHTPPRSLYGYSTMTNWRANPVTKFFGTIINHFCRIIDFNVSQKVDQFISNSKETARRISKFYRRDSIVIYPPVELPEVGAAKFGVTGRQELVEPKRDRQLVDEQMHGEQHQDDQVGKYYLYVNRLSFSKHPELAVAVANKLGFPLKVAGVGSMFEVLKQAAGASVEILGSVSDVELSRLYAGARALIYPVEDEDFGIVPVEAMQRGIPVIAHRSGGPKETIIDGKTGVFFDDLSEAGLVAAIQKFEASKFDHATIKEQGQKFSKEVFQKQIGELVKSKLLKTSGS